MCVKQAALEQGTYGQLRSFTTQAKRSVNNVAQANRRQKLRWVRK